jgi:hypothetical protein
MALLRILEILGTDANRDSLSSKMANLTSIRAVALPPKPVDFGVVIPPFDAMQYSY